jgi:hypothetical protein
MKLAVLTSLAFVGLVFGTSGCGDGGQRADSSTALNLAVPNAQTQDPVSTTEVQAPVGKNAIENVE